MSRHSRSSGSQVTGKLLASVPQELRRAPGILGGQRIVELAGVGLASGVFLDALIIRSVLVPSLMFKFGDANWKLPVQIDKLLPRFRVEGAAARGGRPRRGVDPASSEASAS